MPGTKRSGRKCDWFTDRCAEIIDEEKLLDFVGRVASGKEKEQRATVVRDGNEAHTEIVEVKCSTQDRLAAFKMLADWGIGKPTNLDPHSILPTIQNLINEQAVLKLLYAHNFDGGRNEASGSAFLANRNSPLQTPIPPA